MADPIRRIIRTRLDDIGMTQGTLARKMNVCEATVSNWLKCPEKMTIGNLRKAAKVLGVDVEIIFGTAETKRRR